MSAPTTLTHGTVAMVTKMTTKPSTKKSGPNHRRSKQNLAPTQATCEICLKVALTVPLCPVSVRARSGFLPLPLPGWQPVADVPGPRALPCLLRPSSCPCPPLLVSAYIDPPAVPMAPRGKIPAMTRRRHDDCTAVSNAPWSRSDDGRDERTTSPRRWPKAEYRCGHGDPVTQIRGTDIRGC